MSIDPLAPAALRPLDMERDPPVARSLSPAWICTEPPLFVTLSPAFILIDPPSLKANPVLISRLPLAPVEELPV